MSLEQEHLASGPSSGSSAARDLSAEIAQTVEKEPGDRVRVTWVDGPNYRCNWWAPGSKAAYDNPGMVGLIVTTHRVRQSRFLNVTKVGERLIIRDHSRSRSVET
jgi:hypothetical protein